VKRCQVCKEYKDEEEFSWRFKVLGRRDGTCKACRKKYNDKYFKGEAPERHLQQVRERKQAAHEFAREYVLSYLSTHPCEQCGEGDIRVLEFHHTGDKDQTVSKMVGEGFSIERIHQELMKCKVLCANCHRKLTIEERGWFRKRK
jgi:hypothetical protein